MAKSRNGRGKNRVTNVRVVDEFAGTDGARVDRMLSQINASQSQVRVEIGAAITIVPSTTTDLLGLFTCVSLRQQDEWASMSSQWQEYRVRAMRFDIYDVNPNLTAFSVFSTFHETVQGSTPNYTFAQVIDGPDSASPSGGGGKLRLTWIAKGTRELEFQNLDPNADSITDFGGMRYASGATSVANSKFQVVVKAVVDFRGRY